MTGAFFFETERTSFSLSEARYVLKALSATTVHNRLKPSFPGAFILYDRVLKDGRDSMKSTTHKTGANRTLKPFSVPWITVTGLFMALAIIFSSFGIPVAGGKLYLVDVIICTASILLDPLGAMLVGGLGSFIGDMLFYPAPMFVSLVVHGLQAWVISWCAHNTFKNKPFWGAVLGVSLGTIILVTGYTLGKIYIYSTYEYAMLKLPWEIAQGVIGAACGLGLDYGLGLKKAFGRIMENTR